MPFKPFGKEVPLSLGDLQSEVNQLFNRMWHGGLTPPPLDGNAWAPLLDLREESDRLVLLAEVPGLNADDIEVLYEENRLTLKGERPSPWPEESEGRFLHRERRFGAFCRTIPLPVEVDADGITATARAGVITVTLPKTGSARGRSIKVDVAD